MDVLKNLPSVPKGRSSSPEATKLDAWSVASSGRDSSSCGNSSSKGALSASASLKEKEKELKLQNYNFNCVSVSVKLPAIKFLK